MASIFPVAQSRSGTWIGVALVALIDLPFLAVIIFSNEARGALIFAMLLVPVFVTGLLVFISYAAKNMTYSLDENELRVNFSAAPLRLKYDRLKSAGKVETSLSFRVFGGSWPGAHWGVFIAKDLGNVQVYSTRMKGEYVLLELYEGTRFLLSPADPEGFLAALHRRVDFSKLEPTSWAPPKADKRAEFIQICVVTLAWLGLVSWVLYLYPGLPSIIPVHFGLNGVPNRWGSKLELLLLVGVSTLFPLLNLAFTIKWSRYNRSLNAFLGFVFLLALGLFAFAVMQMISAI